MTIADKLWPRVVWQPNGCWFWTGAKIHGYGVIYFKGQDGKWRNHSTHRVAYELVKGKIPQGLHIDHLCRNPSCCHPYHLEAVTCKENIRRGLKVALKTHCNKGHAFDEINTRIQDGKRICRKCKTLWAQEKRSRIRKEKGR